MYINYERRLAWEWRINAEMLAFALFTPLQPGQLQNAGPKLSRPLISHPMLMRTTPGLLPRRPSCK